ncbi:MarR family winged helix-turn-helix transcriptional regulator [Rhodococcus sp. NPDC003348]
MAATRDTDGRHLATSAWGALLQVHARLVPELDTDLRRATGLPLAWYDVLLELVGADGTPLRMSDLGERVVLSRTRVSRLVAEMETFGLVQRDANPDDRRSAFVTITDAGRRRYREAAPVYLSGIGERFADKLTDSELRAVAAALQKVLEPTSATDNPTG